MRTWLGVRLRPNATKVSDTFACGGLTREDGETRSHLVASDAQRGADDPADALTTAQRAYADLADDDGEVMRF